MRKLNKHSIEQDHLRKLVAKGVQSDVLDARLAYKEADGFHKYASIMLGEDRIYPQMLPTQASGRWSTSSPPLVNFPPSLSDAIMPDEGTYWLSWDWRGIEAVLASAYAGDTQDLEAFKNGHDLHTITCCRMFAHPLPHTLTNPHQDIHWVNSWQPLWTGKDDRRRHLAKTARYALTYGQDERAMLSARGVEKLGLTRDELLSAGRAFLASKPALVAWKQRTLSDCADKGVSYTFLGRRRRLYGDRMERAKMGLNHMIQGAVADMMNLCLADILLGHPELGGWLIVNKHDGAVLSFPFPSVCPRQQVFYLCQSIVEREWDIAGQKVRIMADWKTTDDTGLSTKL